MSVTVLKSTNQPTKEKPNEQGFTCVEVLSHEFIAVSLLNMFGSHYGLVIIVQRVENFTLEVALFR